MSIESKLKTSHRKIKKSCSAKKKYKTKEKAQSRANYLWGKIKLKPYKCSICGEYHLCKIDWRTSLDMAFKDAGLTPIFK